MKCAASGLFRMRAAALKQKYIYFYIIGRLCLHKVVAMLSQTLFPSVIQLIHIVNNAIFVSHLFSHSLEIRDIPQKKISQYLFKKKCDLPSPIQSYYFHSNKPGLSAIRTIIFKPAKNYVNPYRLYRRRRSQTQIDNLYHHRLHHWAPLIVLNILFVTFWFDPNKSSNRETERERVTLGTQRLNRDLSKSSRRNRCLVKCNVLKRMKSLRGCECIECICGWWRDLTRKAKFE